jgi:hypothetical protein
MHPITDKFCDAACGTEWPQRCAPFLYGSRYFLGVIGVEAAVWASLAMGNERRDLV